MLPQMWAPYRWSAIFLLLVMPVPAYQSLAMACAVPSAASHCTRHPRGKQPDAESPCHHATARANASQTESGPTESSAVSLLAGAGDDCCKNHCCCGAITSQWARPTSGLSSAFSLRIEQAHISPGPAAHFIEVSEQDSARAPPHA